MSSSSSTSSKWSGSGSGSGSGRKRKFAQPPPPFEDIDASDQSHEERLLASDIKAEREMNGIGATAATRPLSIDPHSTPASLDTLVSDPLSIENQLTYYSRLVGTKRVRTALNDASSSSSFHRRASPGVERASRDADADGASSSHDSFEFDAFLEECSTHIPDALLRSLLVNDAHIERQESNEDLEGARLEFILHNGRTLAILPTGALMEEIGIAELEWTQQDAPHDLPTPSMAMIHSLPIDSTIRQMLLATPANIPPASHDFDADTSDRLDNEAAVTHALMPLVFVRSCYQVHVATPVIPVTYSKSASRRRSAASSSSSSSTPYLHLLDSHTFRSPIVDIAPNPLIPHEVAILLQDGSLILWSYPQLETAELQLLQAGATNALQDHRRLTHFPPHSYAPHSTTPILTWARLLFVHHARMILVITRRVVVQVDVRAPYTPNGPSDMVPSRGRQLKLPALVLSANERYSSTYLRESAPFGDVLYGASRHPTNPFHVLLVTSELVMLCDTRTALAHATIQPILQWTHQQTGEPPCSVEWIDHSLYHAYRSNHAPTHHADDACHACTENDHYFLTWNRSRTEVTLYHYAFEPFTRATLPAMSAMRGHGLSTPFSSFNPLRLPSIVHALQGERLATHHPIMSIDAAESNASATNPLVGLKCLPTPRFQPSATPSSSSSSSSSSSPRPRSSAMTLFHLSLYGAVLYQQFQHTHDDASPASSHAVVAWKHAHVTPKPSALDGGPASPSPLQRQSSNSSAATTSMTTVTPRRRNRPLSMSPISSSPSTSLGRDLPPWLMPNEIKPFHAVNLKGLLEACAENIAPASDTKSGRDDLTRDTMTSSNSSDDAFLSNDPFTSTPSFSHLLAAMISCINSSAALIFTYLALPKTLFEVTRFMIDTKDVIDPSTIALMKQFGLRFVDAAPSVVSEPVSTPTRRTRRRATNSIAKNVSQAHSLPLPSKQLSARDLQTVAHVVYAALHAFVHSFDPSQSHTPYHIDRWARQMTRIRRGELIDSGAGDDSDADDNRETRRQLDPYSESFPQPTFALYHHHLSLERFAHHNNHDVHVKTQIIKTQPDDSENEDREDDNGEEGEGRHSPKSSPTNPSLSQKKVATCSCSSPSSRLDGSSSPSSSSSHCCCLPICPSSHCLRLHSVTFSASPTILQLHWPNEASNRLLLSTSTPTKSSSLDDDVHVELAPFDPAVGNVAPRLTGAMHQPIVQDLSRDIGFLMSQSQTTEEFAPTLGEQPMSQDIFTQPVDADSVPNSQNPSQQYPNSIDAEEDAPVPTFSNTFALADLITSLSHNWQEAERVSQARVELTLKRSSHPSNPLLDDLAHSVETMESDLSTSNCEVFHQYLLTHQLALAGNAPGDGDGDAMGEDMRGSLLEQMEDQAGGGDDD